MEIKWSSPGGGWIKALIHKSGRHHTLNGRVTKNPDLYQRQELHQPLYLPVSCARLSCAKLFMLVRHYLRVQAAPFLSVFSEAFVHSHLEQTPFCKTHCLGPSDHNMVQYPHIYEPQRIRQAPCELRVSPTWLSHARWVVVRQYHGCGIGS